MIFLQTPVPIEVAQHIGTVANSTSILIGQSIGALILVATGIWSLKICIDAVREFLDYWIDDGTK